MGGRFVFFYLMSNDVERIRATVPSHVAYWKNARLANYAGGPFADRSGGLVLFDANNASEANGYVRKDPFIIEGLAADYWLKEWLPE